MTDSFNRKLGFFLPEDADFWSLVATFSQEIEKALKDLRGEVISSGIRVQEPEGSSFTRETFEEARDALETNGFKLKSLYYTLNGKLSNTNERHIFASVTMALWLVDHSSISNFDVEISAENKVICEGLVATTTNFVERWKSGGFKQTTITNALSPAVGSASAPSVGSALAPSVGSALAPSVGSASVPSQNPFKSAQSWKDHLTELIIAIVAGVIVTAVAYAIFNH